MRLACISGLLRSCRAQHERVHLAQFAAPERNLHLVSRAHDRHVAHMDIARDDRQPLLADLRLIPRWHERQVVVAQRIRRFWLVLAMQFFIQVDIKLGIVPRADPLPRGNVPGGLVERQGALYDIGLGGREP